MGGEQSREVGVISGTRVGGMEGRRPSDGSRPTSTSPRPSICSDADLPYISYTVNRPIGDSPKHGPRSKGSRGSSSSGGSPRRYRRRPQRPQEVVVVREAAQELGLDPEVARLQAIPAFLPIMRGALTAPSARDPDVLERLDTRAMVALCRRYQTHLYYAAYQTKENQDTINSKIREIDSTASGLVSAMTERQKSYAKYAEKFSQVQEVSIALTRCHASLNLILESLETLNNTLPIQERLEPFVWTTG